MNYKYKMKEIVKNIVNKLRYEFCYCNMEYSGIAVFGCCRGIIDADASVYKFCSECKYHVNV